MSVADFFLTAFDPSDLPGTSIDPVNRYDLEIGVPFLAGTHDERMYEELRLRAQTFEVLTGGDVAADGENREGRDDVEEAEGRSQRVALVPLPECLLRELRVNLHVWQPSHPGLDRREAAGDSAANVGTDGQPRHTTGL